MKIHSMEANPKVIEVIKDRDPEIFWMVRYLIFEGFPKKHLKRTL